VGVEVDGGPLALRPYQADAVQAIVAGLRDGGRGQLEVACGAGKTLIACAAAHALIPGDGVTVVLTPSIALVAQILREWARAAEVPGRVLAVCSDDTVLPSPASHAPTREHPMPAHPTPEDPTLHDSGDAPVRAEQLPARVSTDPVVIADWLAGGGRRRVVGTYLSADRIAAALLKSDLEADLLICDEAHHLAGYPGRMTHVLDQGRFPARRRLFMTATRRTEAPLLTDTAGQPTGAARIADAGAGAELVSMDDEAQFGPVLYAYTFGRAIAEEVLDDYRLLVVGMSSAEARSLLAEQRYAHTVGAGGPELRMVVAQAALAQATRRYGLRRVLAYLPRIADAAEFARTLPATVRMLPDPPVGELASRYVSGEMPVRQRETILDALRRPPQGGWAVVANARCLTEGVDLPAVDGILFTNPKRSTVDIVQAIGRALRRGGSTQGVSTIIVPIVIPDTTDPAAHNTSHDGGRDGGQNRAGGEVGDLDPGDFEALWQVARALRAHDEGFAAALDARRGQDWPGTTTLPPKTTVMVPEHTAAQFVAQLSLLLVRQTTSLWAEGIGAARAYHREHGHLHPPSTLVYREFPLGKWLVSRRAERRGGLLPATRVAALDELGMRWTPSRSEVWAERHRLLAAWIADNGRDVPRELVVDGIKLGAWLTDQRQRRRAGHLEHERVAALDELGIAWDPTEQGLVQGVAALREFVATHGHTRVPMNYVAGNGIRLQAWVAARRLRYRQGRLSDEQIQTLQQLGLTWSGRDELWDRIITDLRTYRDTHPDTDIPPGYRTDSIADLHAWLQRQLRQHRRGQLPRHRADDLRNLGIDLPNPQPDPPPDSAPHPDTKADPHLQAASPSHSPRHSARTTDGPADGQAPSDTDSGTA
jgi:superfamily II DNA or RNA helicase